jgi:hypothetical protein
MVVDLKPNEIVIKAGDSNHVSGSRKISGKLIMTNQRMYFVSGEEKASGYDLQIDYSNIQELMFFNVLKVLPKGLSIITKDGSELKFMVKKRDSWTEMINRMY